MRLSVWNSHALSGHTTLQPFSVFTTPKAPTFITEEVLELDLYPITLPGGQGVRLKVPPSNLRSDLPSNQPGSDVIQGPHPGVTSFCGQKVIMRDKSHPHQKISRVLEALCQ